MDFLQEYTEKVFSGEIITGIEIKRMLKILKKDRENENVSESDERKF